MRDFLSIAKALSDENRVRALMALTGGELCVCQIIELLSLAPSTVSKHMAVLHQARLVESRKEGRWIFYRLADPDAGPAVRDAVEWLRRGLTKDAQTIADAKRIKAIRKMNRDDLCARYKS